MAEKKKLYSYVEVDESTPVQKLKITDQLRLLLRVLTHDDANDLKNDDIATTHVLTLKANLFDIFYRSTAPIRNGQKKNVVVSVDSTFEPVLNEVISSPDIANYYNVQVAKPEIEYDVPYNFLVKLTVKES